jgi:hypothetical protein
LKKYFGLKAGRKSLILHEWRVNELRGKT